MGPTPTCGLVASDGDQSSPVQNLLGVCAQLALGVAAPAFGDGISTSVVELHLWAEPKAWSTLPHSILEPNAGDKFCWVMLRLCYRWRGNCPLCFDNIKLQAVCPIAVQLHQSGGETAAQLRRVSLLSETKKAGRFHRIKTPPQNERRKFCLSWTMCADTSQWGQQGIFQVPNTLYKSDHLLPLLKIVPTET